MRCLYEEMKVFLNLFKEKTMNLHSDPEQNKVLSMSR